MRHLGGNRERNDSTASNPSNLTDWEYNVQSVYGHCLGLQSGGTHLEQCRDRELSAKPADDGENLEVIKREKVENEEVHLRWKSVPSSRHPGEEG